ncbi:MAG TPA: hypothetical protein VEJ84_12045, partial [Acidimicrobiales bacterium]|nr:hypothetical protein [Acidimicrobiales bacterium]
LLGVLLAETGPDRRRPRPVECLDLVRGGLSMRLGHRQLPASANAPIAVFGNTVLVPADAPETSSSVKSGPPQLVAYTVP